VLEWVIYYDDESTYTNEDGPPELAPSEGVQVIVKPHPDVGWTMDYSADYYLWLDDHWQGVTEDRFWSYLFRPGWKKILFGERLDDNKWQEVYQRAKRDCHFGRKRGYLPMERKPG
jgi:hypothetical protein